MLKVENLVVAYGGITALSSVSFDVPDNQIVALIGANGAGKSTALRAIIGLTKPKSGAISWNGESVYGLDSQKIVAKGITLTPEGRRVFANLTVLENIKIGAYLRKDEAEIKRDQEWIFELFPILEKRSWQKAGTLSGGEQQMLAVARSLMSKPKLLMMDEPSLGLAPIVVSSIFSIIKKIRSNGVTILLIEQNANMALKIADKGYVLETGKITVQGTGEELLSDPHVKAAYLGTAKSATPDSEKGKS